SLLQRDLRLLLNDDLIAILQDAAGDLEAQSAVTFKLGFGEPLIGRRFMGKGRMRNRVADNSRAFRAVIGRLDVKDRSVSAPRLFPVGCFVFNDGDCMVRNIEPLLLIRW